MYIIFKKVLKVHPLNYLYNSLKMNLFFFKFEDENVVPSVYNWKGLWKYYMLC